MASSYIFIEALREEIGLFGENPLEVHDQGYILIESGM